MSIYQHIGFSSESMNEYIRNLNSSNKCKTNKATFNDKCFNYMLVDDAMELWQQYIPKDENCKYLYFSLTDEHMHEIENLEEDKEADSEYYRFFKFNFQGVSYPIFAEFPKFCVPEIVEGNKYRITFAGAASDLKLYKTHSSFKDDYGDLSIKSILPVISYNEKMYPFAAAYINGYVKEFEKRTNSFTHNGYYKITISTFEYDYVVYAEEKLVDPAIATNDIISVVARILARFEFDDPIEHFKTWTSNDGH